MDESITVEGTARLRRTPDVATWLAVVEGRGASERDAYGACARALHALVAAVGAVADGAEVSVGTVTVGQEWDDSGRRRVGAVASGAVALRGRLDGLERVAQAALDAGAVRLDGPMYEIDGRPALLDALAADAVRAARVRAEALAIAADRRIGRVLRIVDGAAPAPPGPMAEVAYARAAAVEPAPLVPGAQELCATVTVTFSLE